MRLSKRILSIVMTVMMVATCIVSFTSCGDEYTDISGNRYVSVYVYSDSGRRLFYSDAVRVEPNANHEEEWGKKHSVFLALENTCVDKRKNYEIATDATGNVYVQSLSNYVSGVDEYGDEYYWTVFINGEEVEDPTNAPLENYDLIEFKFVEQTYRTIDVQYSATGSGAAIVIDESAASVSGNKYEMTIKYMITYENANTGVKSVASINNIVLAEDGKSIVSIGDIAADDTHEWKVLLNEADIEGTIDEVVLADGDEVKFEYREKTDKGGATTDAAE